MVATKSTKVFVTTHHNLDFKVAYIQKAIDNFLGFDFNEIMYLIVWDEEDGIFLLKEFKKALR